MWGNGERVGEGPVWGNGERVRVQGEGPVWGNGGVGQCG